jgi:hypothetical protein
MIMADQEQKVAVQTPALPKGGGAIQSIGKGWGAVGATGSASLQIPLPITPGRGYAPALGLSYQSSVGNGLFGLGWGLNAGRVSRRATKGVPLYTEDDVMLGPDGGVWLAERDSQGVVIAKPVAKYGDLALDQTYRVSLYFPRMEGAFERIEHWRSADDPLGFWLVHGADGSLAIFGRNRASRIADPQDSSRVAEWLLEETMNASGEHILYEYKAEDLEGLDDATRPGPGRNFMAQRYLWRVRYGNFKAHAQLYLWQPEQLPDLQWHFDLLFDYGERDDSSGLLAYNEDRPWEGRADFHSSFAYGFELGDLRFVHYVLMFHFFPDELDAAGPSLISALTFNYSDLTHGFKVLASVESLASSPHDAGVLERRPPVTFGYQDFDVGQGEFTAFETMPGLDDGVRYQLVDLYGEGLAGVLFRDDKGWMYREPLRANVPGNPDAVRYGPWQLLPGAPVADSGAEVRQSLADLTGDGRLDWIVAQPGMAGFFTLNPDRSWSCFAPFSAFPGEFFHPRGQLADLVGDGLSDLALIGPRSVRLYASQRAEGFAPAREIPHEDDDRLPVLSDNPSELVAFCDILGSGQQHLVRIRHDEVRCWPNLGRGRFGKGHLFAALPFAYEDFDAACVRLADMDGSGAVDLVYLESEGFQLFINTSGHGFADPFKQLWPDGIRYDRLCQVSMADLQGLGCSSLVLSVPHVRPAHWRFDYPALKPYLLHQTNNNMGASGTVGYRSSSQEWLDEKVQLAGEAAHGSGLPFALHVVTRQTQLDEVTGNQLTRLFRYRQAYYDGHDREFRGFGLVVQTDSEALTETRAADGFTAPMQSKTWYHTGRYPFIAPAGFDQSDPKAVVLGADLLREFKDGSDRVLESTSEADFREMARTLAGSVLRVEVCAVKKSADALSPPYSVQTFRYMVRQLAPVGSPQPYARMLPLMLETISYQYEGQADDPMCERTINLAWDAYGVLTHGAGVNYARRKTVNENSPFVDKNGLPLTEEDAHRNTWWKAAHDEAQQRYYLSETRTQAIHLDAEQSWRLGLPYLARVNAMAVEASTVLAKDISYESFSIAGWFEKLPRTLTSLSIQRYFECADGEATFQALADAEEIAELDDHALTAYERVMTPDELKAKLIEVGYIKMTCALPSEPDRTLWSVKRGFNTYGDADSFYRIDAFRPTSSHGVSTVEYDPYSLLVTAVTAPDGCRTSAAYSYHSLQPIKVIDPNQNSQEALYDGFGVLRMTSFYGTELGEEVGFQSLEGVTVPDITPSEAITTPVPTDYATATYYDAFSWMNDQEPVHSIALQWDRYPGDPERQQRMALTSVDGFGRVLQTRQRVESGKAYEVIDGRLSVVDGALVEVQGDPRWRVSERVEYNNKGLAVRVYRPYFSNAHVYVNDSSARDHWHHDQQFYDPLGRPSKTITAKGWWRRMTYLAWYTISEDENDTAEEVNAERKEKGLPLLDDGSATRRKKNLLGF